MDIIDIFQAITKKYIDNTEDAGLNMRNTHVGCYIVQVYVDDSYHNVWFIREQDGEEIVNTIDDYSPVGQLKLLEDFYKVITKGQSLNIAEIPIVKSTWSAEDFGATGFIAKLFTQEADKRDEFVQTTIMNLDCSQITELMHLLGVWDEHTILADYSPEQVGTLVQHGIEQGWDVSLEIERDCDYYLFAKEVKQANYFSKYEITGHIDEFDEIAGLLDIWGVVGSITHDKEKMQIFVDFMKKIQQD